MHLEWRNRFTEYCNWASVAEETKIVRLMGKRPATLTLVFDQHFCDKGCTLTVSCKCSCCHWLLMVSLWPNRRFEYFHLPLAASGLPINLRFHHLLLYSPLTRGIECFHVDNYVLVMNKEEYMLLNFTDCVLPLLPQSRTIVLCTWQVLAQSAADGSSPTFTIIIFDAKSLTLHCPSAFYTVHTFSRRLAVQRLKWNQLLYFQSAEWAQCM